MKKYESLEEEDDFSDYVKVPSIVPEPGFEVYCIAPHFAQNSVVDFFQALVSFIIQMKKQKKKKKHNTTILHVGLALF